MKRTLIAGFALILLSTSCQKEQSVKQEITYDDVIQQKSYDSRKVSYEMMTPEEQANAWKEHLAVMENYFNKDDNKRAFIEEVKSSIVPEMFASESRESFNGLIAEQAYVAGELMTRAEIYFSFYTLEKPPVNLELGQAYGGENGPCHCSSSSDFCSLGNGPLEYSKCDNSQCTQKKLGCGWFWREKCDKKCVTKIVKFDF